jgi:uncharacterized protein YbjT (DUF2867 family)
VTFLSVKGAQSNPLVPRHAIEKHLERSGLENTFLRAAFFMQNLSTTHRDDVRLHDDVMVPAGSGETSFVDVRDLAAVAALTLTEVGHVNRAYELTSVEALTCDEVAQILSEALGRTIRYRHPNVIQFWERMHERCQPVRYVLVMTALGQAGHLSNDTGAFRAVTRSPSGNLHRTSRAYGRKW